MKVKAYALEIKKPDLPLVTLLNDGVTPKYEPNRWLLIEVSEDGREITTRVVAKRELYQEHDIAARSPMLVRLLDRK